MIHVADCGSMFQQLTIAISSKFWWEIALARTSSVRGGVCDELVIRRGEVSTLPIQRVGLTPDVPCLQHASWIQVWIGVEY